MISAGIVPLPAAEVAPAAPVAPAAETAGASSGALSGMTAISGAMLITQLGAAYFGYRTAKTQIASQLKMAERGYEHQDRLAKLDRDSKIGYLDTQAAQQRITADGAVEYNKAVAERKKAEDGNKVMDAKIKQLKLNDRAGRIRNQHFYGRAFG